VQPFRGIDRAQDVPSSRTVWAKQLFDKNINIIDDPHARARPALASRSIPKASRQGSTPLSMKAC
jgi:hypothetical protein